MRGLPILVLCSFSFLAGGAVDIYIDSPVILLDCRSPRQEDQWMFGTTEATTPIATTPKDTTKITEKPSDPREFFWAARRGELQYIENEIIRLGPSGLNLDWQNPERYGYPNQRGWTALHTASENNKPSVVSALLAAGANPNITDEGGRTPIYIATQYGRIDVLRLLLDPKYQADVNLADNDGQTPVYRAAYYEGNEAALELLLAQGRGDPNKVDKYGTSPLMVASKFGRLACIRALLAAGAHIDYVKPRNGYTALHQTAGNNQPDAALVLLEAGANKEIKNNDGKTPAKLARNNANFSLSDLIQNY